MFESPSHWLIVAVVVLVLFGYKKLPDAARSVGRSLRIFKTEIKGMADDDKAREAEAAQAELPQPPAQTYVPPAAPATPAAPPTVDGPVPPAQSE
jgi:sec-independent protein translocase protein TatA